MSPRVGVTLSGRYRLQRLIATGGMGQVWEGIDSRLGRRVAVKVLKAEYSTDAEFVERFRAEARTARRSALPAGRRCPRAGWLPGGKPTEPGRPRNELARRPL